MAKLTNDYRLEQTKMKQVVIQNEGRNLKFMEETGQEYEPTKAFHLER